MKRILVIVMAMVLATTAIFADKQKQARTTFKQLSYNFGTIKEANGPVSHEFEFTNTGKGPLLIVDVAASCGCTRPEFPTQPIKPGKKGKVKVTYSPIGRPGAFRKTVKVKTNGSESVTTLVIEGVVVPKSK